MRKNVCMYVYVCLYKVQWQGYEELREQDTRESSRIAK